MPIAIAKRPVRIGGISGAVLDRREGMQEMVLGDEQIDALCGDFMSEWSEYRLDLAERFLICPLRRRRRRLDRKSRLMKRYFSRPCPPY